MNLILLQEFFFSGTIALFFLEFWGLLIYVESVLTLTTEDDAQILFLI